jgi:hypothetical protein
MDKTSSYRIREELTELRRKDLPAALARARKELEGSPDAVVRGAAGWVFWEALKNSLGKKQKDEALLYLREYKALELPDSKDDDLLFEKMGQQLAKLFGTDSIFRFVELARPSKQSLVGWTIVAAVNNALSGKPPDVNLAVRLLESFQKLTVERPSRLYSEALLSALPLKDHTPEFKSFLRWWGLDNLRRYADWAREPIKPSNVHVDSTRRKRKYYPSLAEKVAKALGKHFDAFPGDPAVDTQFIDFIRDVREQFSDNVYLRYYIAMILLSFGDRDQARKVMIRAIRDFHLHNDFKIWWAWRFLARCYSETDKREIIACLCKSIECEEDEAMLRSVRKALADALMGTAQPAAARRELLNIIEVHNINETSVPADVLTLENALKTITPEASNDLLYKSCAREADALLTKDLPWLEGTLISHKPDSADRKPLSIVLVSTPQGPAELYARGALQQNLASLSPGTPLRVQVFRVVRKKCLGTLVLDEKEELRIEQFENRSADPWDLVPEEIGVVGSIEEDKCRINLDGGRQGLAYYNAVPFARSLSEGAFVKVRLSAPMKPKPTGRHRTRSPKQIVITIQPTSERPPCSVYKTFVGFIERAETREDSDETNACDDSLPAETSSLNDDYGVVDDVRISRELMQTSHLNFGDGAEGQAFLKRRSYQSDEWEAATVHLFDLKRYV